MWQLYCILVIFSVYPIVLHYYYVIAIRTDSHKYMHIQDNVIISFLLFSFFFFFFFFLMCVVNSNKLLLSTILLFNYWK